jgi:hypothetical protein
MGVIATQADQQAGSMQAIGTLGQSAGTVDNAAAVDVALADSTTWSAFPRHRS